MSKLVVLDSNLIIYAVNGSWSVGKQDYANIIFAASAMSKLETLGYHAITSAEASRLGDFFGGLAQYSIDEAVITQAITLRQRKRMSTGDAIIAATAMIHDAELWTHNLSDFAHLTEVRVFDPIAA